MIISVPVNVKLRMSISVLYVDDEPDFHIIVKTFLAKESDLLIQPCASAKKALDMLSDTAIQYDVIVSDFEMPEMNGIAFLKEVRVRYGNLPFILFTGRGREEVVMDAVNYGADYYLQKAGDPIILFTDLTHKIRMAHERSIAEKRANEHDRRFKKTLDQIHMVAFHLDEDGTILYGNNYLLDLTGWSYDEFIGKNFFDIAVPPDLREINRGLFGAAFSRRSISQHEEMKLLLRSGEIRDLDIFNTDLRDEKGRFLGYMCIGEDVTDRKKAQEEIASWKHRYELLTALSGQIAYEYDIDSDTAIYSKTTKDVLGYEPEELGDGGKDRWYSLIHPDDREEISAIIEHSLFHYSDLDIQCRFRTKNGNYRWIHSRGYLDRSSPESHKLLGIITDIQHQKEAEVALYRSEERFRMYVEKSPFGIFITDRHGSSIFVNPAMQALTGYTSEECNHMNVFDLACPGQRHIHEEHFHELLDTGYLQTRFPLHVKDNRLIQVELDAVLLPGGDILCFFHDITDEMKAEQKILEISKKLDLLRLITSHDIMNVLTSIRGYLYLQETAKTLEEGSVFVHKITDLLIKIEELIKFSRTYETIGVHQPSWQHVHTSISQIPTTGLPITCTIPPTLEIFADPMLDHVFANLYHNSCHHGGSVSRITCSLLIGESDCTILWEDDGQGIADDEKDEIFILGHGNNSGLGLYFIKEILAITNITISETGNVGEGARFEISIPWGQYRINSAGS